MHYRITIRSARLAQIEQLEENVREFGPEAVSEFVRCMTQTIEQASRAFDSDSPAQLRLLLAREFQSAALDVHDEARATAHMLSIILLESALDHFVSQPSRNDLLLRCLRIIEMAKRCAPTLH